MAKKVLLIEDNPTQVKFAKLFLEHEGIDVDTALTGKEGLEKAREGKPDLILLDLGLPDIDGLDVCSQIKQDENIGKTTVVVFSARDNMEDVTKAYARGANDYVIKTSLDDFLKNKLKVYLVNT